MSDPGERAAPGPDGRSIVAGLQAELETIYRVEAPLSAADCMLDRAAWESLSASGAPEELLVVEGEEGLEVGLYLEASVLGALSRPSAAWTHRRLSAHCQAVEGVSHFLYLAHRASASRPVSLLELELQAEIDKFATVLLRLWMEGRRHAASPLRSLLFERVSYRPNLAPEARARYEKANLLAGLYCRFLEARYVVADSLEGLLADLRRMYRLGAGEKLSYAARGAAL